MLAKQSACTTAAALTIGRSPMPIFCSLHCKGSTFIGVELIIHVDWSYTLQRSYLWNVVSSLLLLLGRIFWQFFYNSSVNFQPILVYYVSKCSYDQLPQSCRARFLIFDFKKFLGGENPLFWGVELTKIFNSRARCMKFGFKIYIGTLNNIIKKISKFSKRGSSPPLKISKSSIIDLDGWNLVSRVI